MLVFAGLPQAPRQTAYNRFAVISIYCNFNMFTKFTKENRETHNNTKMNAGSYAKHAANYGIIQGSAEHVSKTTGNPKKTPKTENYGKFQQT